MRIQKATEPSKSRSRLQIEPTSEARNVEGQKDTQSMLRQASIEPTGDVYTQTIEKSVLDAVNSRTGAVLDGCAIGRDDHGAGRLG